MPADRQPLEAAAGAQASIDWVCINTMRTLAMDAVQKAKSGHPGTPMALAPVAYCLWDRFLRFDPSDPIWPDRDRFVLSNGHASMLLYSLLLLSQTRAVNADYETLGTPAVSLDDIKRFRQLGSKCPGHPEYRLTSGVEATTGPLGQGLGASVGMAVAGRWLAARYNRPGFPLFGYRVYALCGDGDMMEGVSSEAASLAGHLRLANLCWIYDDNKITLDGRADLSFTEDVAARFMGYGWSVLRVTDANDLERLSRAFEDFQAAERPALVIVDSHIAYGAPRKQDTSAAHGEPLGEEEVRAAKRAYGWPEDAQFLVPAEALRRFAQTLGARGQGLRKAWGRLFARYREAYPEPAEGVIAMQRRRLPEGWDKDLSSFPADAKGLATRESSARALEAVARNVGWLIGGSADLATSTKARLSFPAAGDVSARAPGGRNIHFGVREHAMCAVANGLSLCKLRPFASSFLTFSDYCRPAIRLSALMELPAIYIFTHDSIGLGEDGPTHQPVEHLASLRAIPGVVVLRPADANEVVEAWRVIMPLRHRPAVLVLSRQPLPTLDRSRCAAADGLARGAYVLAEAAHGRPQAILIGTGSEVSLCLEAYERLAQVGIHARVVSMPSWELFEEQDQAYRDSILPPDITARVSVEQGSTLGWDRYVGPAGIAIGMKTFGASAPLKELLTKFGFTPGKIAEAVRQLAQRK